MKNLKNLGKVLGKKEQKSINGGERRCGRTFCEICSLTYLGKQRCANKCRSWIQNCI